MSEADNFIWMSFFAVAAMIVNSLGIYAIYRNRAWADRNKEYFMCFAAGVLISSPLIMAFPEAVQKNPNAGLAALGGFMFMYLSNKIIKHKTKQTELAFGITAIEGIGIHSFVDGIVYCVTFRASVIVGVLAGMGLLVHEFAEGVITYSVLTKGGVNEKKAVFYAFLVAALTTPVGAFIAFPFVRHLNESVLGLALGFVAGVLIYISASHLLPEASEHEKEHSYTAFSFGVFFALLIMWIS